MNDRTTTPSSGSDTPVTVLGLGLMGHALAAAFLADGRPTTVWNRSPAKAEPLVVRGATLAASAGDAVAASPLVVICVSDYPAVHEVLDPLTGVLAGRVVVNLTSGTSAQARETADWAARHDVVYLEGVILAVPPAIGTDEGVILYCGPQEAFSAHESTLRSLGEVATWLGDDPVLSSLYDMAVLSIMWNLLNGFLHGAALVGTAKVSAATAAPILIQAIGTVAGWLNAYAEQIDDGAYPAFDSTIDTHRAAMDHLVHQSQALGVNDELPRFIKALADRAVAAGHGGNGYAAMIEVLRTPT